MVPSPTATPRSTHLPLVQRFDQLASSPTTTSNLPRITTAPIVAHSPEQLVYAYALPIDIEEVERDRQADQVANIQHSIQYQLYSIERSTSQAVQGAAQSRGDGESRKDVRSVKGKERERVASYSRSSNSEQRGSRPFDRNSRRRRGGVLPFVEGIELGRRSYEKRQLPEAEGYPSCNYVGNGVLSCFPESNTTIVEGEYSKFIWNAQYPTFIGAGDVDIYLYNANTEDIATSWTGVQNARGMIGITPDDAWWPQQSATSWFNSDRNRTIPYFFVIVDGGSQLTGGEDHQSTFTVIQTAPPSSLSSTLAILTASSLSSVASLSSISSLSAASVASSLSSLTASSTSSSASSRGTNSNGELQPSSSSSSGPSIPRWAIAIIVILGFFALVAGAVAIYFCLGRMRKRRQATSSGSNLMAQTDGEEGGVLSGHHAGEREGLTAAGAGAGAAGAGLMGSGRDRGDSVGGETGFSSNGSREPILGSNRSAGGGGGSGGMAPAVLGGGAGGLALGALLGGRRRSEKGSSEIDQDEKSGGLDRNDAARMADAFRAALRRPEFPHKGTESSGEDSQGIDSRGGIAGSGGGARGETNGESPTGSVEGEEGRGRELLEEELRSEGMSMRNAAGGGEKRWGGAGSTA